MKFTVEKTCGHGDTICGTNCYRFLLDDVELTGLLGVRLELPHHDIPRVLIEFLPDGVEVDADLLADLKVPAEEVAGLRAEVDILKSEVERLRAGIEFAPPKE